MKYLVIEADNKFTVRDSLAIELLAPALKALGDRFPSGRWRGDGLAFIAGAFSRPFAPAVFKKGKQVWGVVPLIRGLSSRLERDDSPEYLDFGMTPAGLICAGPAGQVSFEDQDAPQLPVDVIRWLNHGERGMSSEAICRALYGVPALLDEEEHPFPTPRDPSDLRLCFGFLDNYPVARERLSEMSAKSPEWESLVAHWSTLESVFRSEYSRKGGQCSSTFELMKQLHQPA